MEKEEKKKVMLKNIEIAVLSIIIVALLTLIIYMVFIKKDDNEGVDDNQNNNLPMVELAEFYEFKDNTQDRTDTFFVTTNGEVYLFSTYEDYYGYNELAVKEYNIKNVGSYRNNKTFSGIKLNLSNIKKIYNVEVGNGGVNYFAFLTSDNRLYFTNDYSLNLFTSDELIDIVNVIDEEKCSSDGSCAMWAYAINNKNEKIDLYDIEKKLTEE